MKVRKCKHCHNHFTIKDVKEMLRAMFGAFVDEDYLVSIQGLCPRCWPEY